MEGSGSQAAGYQGRVRPVQLKHGNQLFQVLWNIDGWRNDDDCRINILITNLTGDAFQQGNDLL